MLMNGGCNLGIENDSENNDSKKQCTSLSNVIGSNTASAFSFVAIDFKSSVLILPIKPFFMLPFLRTSLVLFLITLFLISSFFKLFIFFKLSFASIISIWKEIQFEISHLLTSSNIINLYSGFMHLVFLK